MVVLVSHVLAAHIASVAVHLFLVLGYHAVLYIFHVGSDDPVSFVVFVAVVFVVLVLDLASHIAFVVHVALASHVCFNAVLLLVLVYHVAFAFHSSLVDRFLASPVDGVACALIFSVSLQFPFLLYAPIVYHNM